jgi:hypothetical protein
LVGGAFQNRAIDPRTAHLAELLRENFTLLKQKSPLQGARVGNPRLVLRKSLGRLLLNVALLAGLAGMTPVRVAYAASAWVVTTLSDINHGSCSVAV